MSKLKPLVIDANILLRAVFGVRVLSILETYEDTAAFYSPEVCFEDALRYIPDVAARRSVEPQLPLLKLNHIAQIVGVIDRSLYQDFEESARTRIESRDLDDWPIVATALMLNAPIWTEDRDFFGSGIATWTSNRVEIYLRDS